MFFIYNLSTIIVWGALNLVAFFSPKIKFFVEGRNRVFTVLKNKIAPNDEFIWVHTASLGEFEQGLPIIEKLKKEYPTYKILVTFFSPSGYEIKKDTPVADAVTYLPMDTKNNVHRFIEVVRPKLVLFVKYEIWPNYLRELHKRKIPTILVSAIFSKKQVYFKWYGGFMRKALQTFSHFFVQDEQSKKLLETIDCENVTISGDTRLDRVSEILERDNALEFMEHFRGNKLCFVAGSTWPEDEKILVDFINSSPKDVKFVLAPHTIKTDKINALSESFNKKVLLYSNLAESNPKKYEILIIDTIGLLTKIYSYADIAYVGGGFATGLHNTLEPAVFGIPVIIGPDYNGFKEAEELVADKGILSISNAKEFNEVANKLISSNDLRLETGSLNKKYILNNKGASIQIMQYIRKLL